MSDRNVSPLDALLARIQTLTESDREKLAVVVVGCRPTDVRWSWNRPMYDHPGGPWFKATWAFAMAAAKTNRLIPTSRFIDTITPTHLKWTTTVCGNYRSYGVKEPAAAAVVEAIRALMLRDLIGQHELTRAHYDLITRPWAVTFGAVHPDDPEVR